MPEVILKFEDGTKRIPILSSKKWNEAVKWITSWFDEGQIETSSYLIEQEWVNLTVLNTSRLSDYSPWVILQNVKGLKMWFINSLLREKLRQKSRRKLKAVYIWIKKNHIGHSTKWQVHSPKCLHKKPWSIYQSECSRSVKQMIAHDCEAVRKW